MKKKIYALLASFMLAVSMLLTACGNADAIAGNIASQAGRGITEGTAGGSCRFGTG